MIYEKQWDILKKKERQGSLMRVLAVIDMQKDFIDGVLGTKEAAAIVPSVMKKIEEYRQRGDMVIFTRDTHHEDYLDTREGRKLPVPHCIEGSEGWKIWPDIDTEGSLIIDKPSFGSPELAALLQKKNRQEPLEGIELIGLCTDICVISNAIMIKNSLPETEVSVDPLCCAGVMPETHHNALKAMSMCQIDIKSKGEEK